MPEKHVTVMPHILGELILHLKQISYETFTGRFDFDLFDYNSQVLATIREPKQHLRKTVFRNILLPVQRDRPSQEGQPEPSQTTLSSRGRTGCGRAGLQ